MLSVALKTHLGESPGHRHEGRVVPAGQVERERWYRWSRERGIAAR
jgi:hypothetical protein